MKDEFEYHVRFLLSEEIEIEPTSFNNAIFNYSKDPYKILKRKFPNLIPSIVNTLLDMEQNNTKMTMNEFVEEFMKNKEYIDLIEKINQAADNKIDELEIIVKTNDRNEAINEASRRAHLICNYLSYKYKDSIVPTFTSLTKYKNNIYCGTESVKFLMVYDSPKLTFSNEINTIDTNMLNYEYSYFCRALTSAKNLDYAGAIRDYYQIIENNVNDQKLQHLKKYWSLRNLLSHGEPLSSFTINRIKTDFPEIEVVNDRFDYSSNKNVRSLRLHCDYLREEIFMFLELKKIV